MKLGEIWDRPFEIRKVHINGKVTAAPREGVAANLNVRRVKSYKSPTSDL